MEDKTEYSFAEVESRADAVFHSMGLDLRTSYNDFLHNVARNLLSEGDIKKCFTPIEEKVPVADLCGILKGKIWYADDFDESMEWVGELLEKKYEVST